MMLDFNAFARTNVLVIGDVMLDHYVEGDVSRVSDEAPVPILHVKNERFVAGGAANVAMNCAGLGAKVTLISVVGLDDASKELENCLAASDKIACHFISDVNRPTTIKTRYMGRNQQVVRVDREIKSALCDNLEDKLLKAFSLALGNSSIVIVSDYAKGVLTDKVLRIIMQRSRDAGLPVIVDPKRKDLSAYSGATVITPNRKELSLATGLICEDDLECERAAECAINATGSAILLTRSEKGMSYLARDVEPIHVEAAAQQVFDVSGAGDTVIATFAVALARDFDIRTSVQLANLSAGLAVAKVGTAPIHIKELCEALRSKKKNMSDASTEIVCNLDDARRHVSEWHSLGLSVGFTNGCFDLIHPGHVRTIACAAAECDRLIVAVNSDASVKKLKGSSRPIQPEDARASVVAGLKGVSLVIVFSDETPLDLIVALRPNVLVKGADYSLVDVVGYTEVLSWGGRVVTVELESGHSTTSIAERILASTMKGAF